MNEQKTMIRLEIDKINSLVPWKIGEKDCYSKFMEVMSRLEYMVREECLKELYKDRLEEWRKECL